MEHFTANKYGKCAKAHSELCEKYSDCSMCPQMKGAMRRLAYYEDMEEQGRLVVLPCKVGDMIYDIYEAMGNGVGGPRPLCFDECKIHIDKRGKAYLLANGYLLPFDEFGETLFLTHEEAEKALEGGAET